MCRMIAAPLGVSGHLLIDAFMRMARGHNALNELNPSHGAWTHSEGWGAVFERAGRLEVLRSVNAVWEDPDLETLRDRRVFLLHARKASSGAVALTNTHPFEYEIEGARWFFCHNGTVRDPLPTPSTLLKSTSTDSEKIFHMLLPEVAEGRVLDGMCDTYGSVRNFTCLNSFLLGAKEFWAASLYSENPDYYTLSFVTTPNGPIFSSEELSEFAGMWTVIPNGHAVRVDLATGRNDVHAFL
jgi:predicted glutamine amidotransferase